MPIYAYQCEACGAEEEHMQRFSDDPMTECQACGGPLKKLISAPAFHLKGGGWYKDGYASTKPGGDSGGDSGGSVPAESGSKPSSDSGGSASGSSGSGSSGSSSSSSGGSSSSSKSSSSSPSSD